MNQRDRNSAWKRVWALALAVLFVMLGTACGPITATTALRDAREAVDRADRVDAEIAATYEYVSAVEYLEKAREEWHYSDFQRALEYARRAEDFAEAAYDRAMQSNTTIPGVEEVPDDI